MRFQRSLKLRQVLLIHTLGAELNMRRCAEVLNTSQPAVSRALNELEEQLGEKLFVRTTRSITPTPVGLNLIWHARRILGELERAEADFHALSRGATQSLHIGVLSGFSPRLLAQATAMFAKRLPKVEVRVHEGFADELFVSLMQDDVNLILSHLEVSRSTDDLTIQPLYMEHVAIVAPLGHALTRQRQLKIADLVDHQWLLPPLGTTVRSALEKELMRSSSQRLPGFVENTGPHFIAAMLKHASLITAVPNEVARWLVDDCNIAQVLSVRIELPSWPVCSARRTLHPPSKAESTFLECVHELAEAMSPGCPAKAPPSA